MKKIICAAFALVFLAACTPSTKPVFCYELSAQEQQPGKNCIPSGGNGGG